MTVPATSYLTLINIINKEVIKARELTPLVNRVREELYKVLSFSDLCIEMPEIEIKCKECKTVIPVKYGDRSVGNIYVNKLLDDELREMLNTIADSLALADEHIRLKKLKDNFQDQIRSFKAVLTTLHSRLNVDEILEKILKNLGMVLTYKASNIHLLDIDSTPKTYRIVHNRGYKEINKPEPTIGVHIPLDSMPIYKEMIATGNPYIIPDTHNDPEWTIFPETKWIRSYVSAPIRFDNQVIGFINVDSDIPNYYTDKHGEILQLFADEISVTLHNARLYETAQRANRELRLLANIDGLTKIANRRKFDIFLDKELERAGDEGSTLTLLLVDIDYFKKYNDCYGHLQGDACLIEVTEIMKSTLKRSRDLLCRYGGEEFAIILPETNGEQALIIAKEVFSKLKDAAIEHKESNISSIVTCSIGIASTDSLKKISKEELIKNSDSALYRAKNKGRNRIEKE